MSSDLLDLPKPKLLEDRAKVEPFPEINLIDKLLQEQQTLQTPIARFSDKHDQHRLPDQLKHYKDLIPLSKPTEGQQYAFHVELDKCTSCKACVTACHSLNGLDEGEAWRDVGTLLGGKEKPEWQQTITSACHHCGSPECLNGCPVGAYDKDKETGIVRHLDDQCIGCQYCILKCPFDVPKYNNKRGIVRKCDMCYSRLAEGEAPACVQACPNEAISIRKVSITEKSAASLRGEDFLIGAPDPSITLPTTTYSGRNVPTTAYGIDKPSLRVEHMHWPLVAMLTLTQIGVGFSITAALLDSHQFTTALIACIFVFAGLGLGAFHLGKPLGAWRFFLGLKTSWLSREFAVFGAYSNALPMMAAYYYFLPNHQFQYIADIGVSLLGLIAVFTSVMIYADTKRPWWSVSRNSFRFYITTFASAAALYSIINHSLEAALISSALLLAKLISELLFLKHSSVPTWSPLQHSARVLREPLQLWNKTRIIFVILAIILLPLFPIIGLTLLILAELVERALFFKAIYHPRMPGGITGPGCAH